MGNGPGDEVICTPHTWHQMAQAITLTGVPPVFARQIMKRSSDRHWAVLPHEPTRMEARFLAEQNIARIDMPLAQFSNELIDAMQPALVA
jgi:hypothetical protein